MTDLERRYRTPDGQLHLLKPVLGHLGMSIETFDEAVAAIKGELQSRLPAQNPEKYRWGFERILVVFALYSTALTHKSNNIFSSLSLMVAENLAKKTLGDISIQLTLDALTEKKSVYLIQALSHATSLLIPEINSQGRIDFVDNVRKKVQHLPGLSGS
jgi:capsule polysaccharide export protein KpsC/LpsZ